MKSKLARYPIEYTQILLACPADGTPLDIPMSSPDLAARERMQFYNFLKFVRRNPGEAAHFGNRPNLIMLSIHDNILRFQLRTPQATTELGQGLKNALAALNQTSVTLPTIPTLGVPEMEPLDENVIPPEPLPSGNLVDMFTQAINERNNATNGKE